MNNIIKEGFILVADACVFCVANYPHDLAQACRLMIQICSPDTTIKRNKGKETLHGGSLSHEPVVLCDPWLFFDRNSTLSVIRSFRRLSGKV